jgi:hypothetical protein
MSEAAAPEPTDEPPTERLRTGEPPPKNGPAQRATEWVTDRSAVVVVLAGLGVVLAAYGLSLIAFDTGDDVGTALAPITGVIGTIVGAYFGIQAGSAGKAESDQARDQAEKQAKALAAVADAGAAERVLRETGGW